MYRFDYNIEGHRYLMSLLAAKNASVKLMDPWVRECLDSIPGKTSLSSNMHVNRDMMSMIYLGALILHL